MKTQFFLLSMVFVLSACSSDTTPVTPVAGSNEWLEWVESQVHTDDGEGHGPDWGGNEWCGVIDYRLFNRKSGLEPCSQEWQKKVTQVLVKR